MKTKRREVLIRMGASIMIVLGLTSPAWPKLEVHVVTTEPTVEHSEAIHDHSHVHVRESECLSTAEGNVLLYDSATLAAISAHPLDQWKDAILVNIQTFSAIFRHAINIQFA